MKKKYFWSLLTMIMVAMLSVCFASCSSDDDNDGSFKSSDLVGTWKSIKTETHIYTFNADGTVDGWSTYSHWSYSDGKLYMTRSNNGRIETWLVEYKDNLLYLTLPDGEATEYKTLMKVHVEESDNTENEGTGVSITEDSRFFVGNWKLLVSGTKRNTTSFFTFFPNGKVLCDGDSKGQWLYESEKSFLPTTIDLWQFYITSRFTDAWTGECNGQTVNASRESDNSYLTDYLKAVSFAVDSQDPFYMEKGYSTGKTIYSTDYSDHLLSFSDIYLSDNQIKAVAKEEWTEDSYSKNRRYIFKRPMVINNPYSNKPVLTFSKEAIYFSVDKYKNNDTIYNSGNNHLKTGTYQGKWSF